MEIKEIKTLEKLVQELFHTNEVLPFETSIQTFPKGSVLLLPGQIENNIYYVHSGIVQSSILASSKQEKIYGFAFPGQLFNSLASFMSQQPTDLTFTCITDCTLECIPRESFNKALEHSILANKFMKYFYEYIYLFRVNKEREMLTLSGAERYSKLMKNHPEIIKLLPVGKIAKYLGIHPRSLSRLRKF
jgi:CRP-like cAMP-binding protein